MRQILVAAVVMVGFVAVSGLFIGCEDSPDTNNVDSYFGGNAADDADERPSVVAAPMAVSPETTILSTNGAVAQFKIAGTSRAVTWSVRDLSKGSILTQSRDAATYRRSDAGGNVVIATDSRGNAAFATITQP